MTLVHGGFRDFPLGIYTDEERNALDNATAPDPDAGGSTFPLLDGGAQKRYGFTLHRIPDGTKPGLRRALNTPGLGLAVAGSLGHLPNGHRLRRWQPDFTGGHAIAVVALGGGRVWWGDPLAPMKFEGDTATVDNVLTFAWYPSDARVTFEFGIVGKRTMTMLRNSREALKTARTALAAVGVLIDQIDDVLPEDD